MIKLTLFDNTGITVNADLIEFIEETPDTVVSLTSGKKLVVKESSDEVVGRVVDYKRQITMGVRTVAAHC
jgi:flagellar protein FlbD